MVPPWWLPTSTEAPALDVQAIITASATARNHSEPPCAPGYDRSNPQRQAAGRLPTPTSRGALIVSITTRPAIGIFGSGKVAVAPGLPCARRGLHRSHRVLRIRRRCRLTRYFARGAIAATSEDLPEFADILIIAVPTPQVRDTTPSSPWRTSSTTSASTQFVRDPSLTAPSLNPTPRSSDGSSMAVVDGRHVRRVIGRSTQQFACGGARMVWISLDRGDQDRWLDH